MEIKKGYLHFVSDEFFDKANLHIEKLMLAEYQSEKTGFEADEGKKTLEQSTQKMSIKDRIATSQAEAERRNSARAADHPQSSKHELER